MNNLDLLRVFHFNGKKKRYGRKEDGGYIVGTLDTKYDCYLSCGVSDEESFTRDFLNDHKYLNKNNSYALDGTIKQFPTEYTKNINFIRKNIGGVNNSKVTNLHDLINKHNNIFLKMDIEGGEYPWLLSLDLNQLRKFGQIVIELHSLCKDGDFNNINPTKKQCLDKLSRTHYIVHAHGNNNGLIVNSIPDVLELTYINKKYFNTAPKPNRIPFPIKNLDYPNIPEKPDVVLDKYPFVNKLNLS